MDENTMKLGLCMEAAHANQKVAAASLKQLKLVTNDLTQVVKDEVHRVLVEELQSLAEDSRRASDALYTVRRAATLRTVVWSVAITSLCATIPLGLACWIVPSPAEIASLRARRAELTARIAELEKSGARIDLRRCGDGARLCVRVDRKTPLYGEQSDYLIVKGY